MNGTINECFIDSSVLIEYIKGTQTEVLELLLSSDATNYISHIVYSEFIFHFLSVISGKSPLTLKKSSHIHDILMAHHPIEFIRHFKVLSMEEEIIDKSDEFMSRYNLLPNDSLILATCKIYGINHIASFDSDFKDICEKEEILLISTPEQLKAP